MSVDTKWNSPLIDAFFGPLFQHHVEDDLLDGNILANINLDDNRKKNSGLFTIVLPVSGAVLRPRSATQVALFLSCVAIGGVVTSIFLHFGKMLAVNNFPAVLLALITVLALYFYTSSFFAQLFTSLIQRLPKSVCKLIFEESPFNSLPA